MDLNDPEEMELQRKYDEARNKTSLTEKRKRQRLLKMLNGKCFVLIMEFNQNQIKMKIHFSIYFAFTSKTMRGYRCVRCRPLAKMVGAQSP